MPLCVLTSRGACYCLTRGGLADTLGEKGAVRVHGGGLAGTIQAFVPTDEVKEYVSEMNRIFGNGSCYVLRIRSLGGIEVTEGL